MSHEHDHRDKCVECLLEDRDSARRASVTWCGFALLMILCMVAIAVFGPEMCP